MAIVSMNQLPGRESSYGSVQEHTAKIEWLCVSDSRFEYDYTIINYGWNNNILPRPYYTVVFGLDPYVPMLCRSLSVKQDANAPVKYVVTAEYSSAPLSQSEKNQDPNPLNRPSTYKWKTNKYNKAIHKDINDEAITNSAGEYFDPPPELELFRWTVQVTTNVSAIPGEILDFAEGGPINSDGFTIQGLSVSPYTARVVDMDIGEMMTARVADSEVNYFQFSYSLEFRKEDWTLRLVDQGTMQIDPDDDTKRIPIKDDGVPPKDVKKPWPLDGNGARLDNPTPETAVELDFDVIQDVEFSGILPGMNT